MMLMAPFVLAKAPEGVDIKILMMTTTNLGVKELHSLEGRKSKFFIDGAALNLDLLPLVVPEIQNLKALRVTKIKICSVGQYSLQIQNSGTEKTFEGCMEDPSYRSLVGSFTHLKRLAITSRETR